MGEETYNVKKARELAGLSQKQMAEALGITQQSVYYYESGTRDIKASMLLKMSKVTGVTVSYLLGLTNNPHEKAYSGASLSPDERELLGCYRSCTPERQDALLNLARDSALLSGGAAERGGVSEAV